MSRKITLIPPLILMLVGAFCWYIAGRVTGMASFKDADNVILDYPSKVANIWALCGAGAGLLAYIYFLIKPQEHKPVLPQIAKRPGSPKTVVEAKMGFLIMNLGLLIGILLPLLLPPKSSITGESVGRSAMVRVLVGCVTTFFSSGIVVPLSFWMMTKIMVSKRSAWANLTKEGQATENFSMALRRFFHELPKAKPFLVVDMAIALIILIFTGGLIGQYLILMFPTFKPITVGPLIIVGIIVLWLVAFGSGFIARPMRYFPEYPPLRMMRGTQLTALVLNISVGIIIGLFADIPVLKSLWYAAAGTFGSMLIMFALFALFTFKTMAGVKITGDKNLMIADAYRGIWLFSSLSLVVMYYILQQFNGNPLILNSSMITAVCSIGYASGYIP